MTDLNDKKSMGASGVSSSDWLDFLDSLGQSNSAKWTLTVKPWGVYLDKASSDGFETASDCLRRAFFKSNAEMNHQPKD